jgi:hypothetical protein
MINSLCGRSGLSRRDRPAGYHVTELPDRLPRCHVRQKYSTTTGQTKQNNIQQRAVEKTTVSSRRIDQLGPVHTDMANLSAQSLLSIHTMNKWPEAEMGQVLLFHPEIMVPVLLGNYIGISLIFWPIPGPGRDREGRKRSRKMDD